MATAAQIQSALANASDLDWSDMARLLKGAIASALVNGAGEVEMPWTTTGADGVQVSRLPLDQAVALHAKMQALSSGGVVPQFAEFRGEIL